jgi:hypothetical protein
LDIILSVLNDTELEKTEGELSQEDWLVSYLKTTLNPSVDSHTDVESKINNTQLLNFIEFSVLNSLEEECLEGLK